MRRSIRAASVAAAATTVVMTLAACTAPPTSSRSASAPPPSTARPTETAAGDLWAPTGAVTTLAKDLDAPWSVVPLEGGGALIGQRDDARVLELTAGGRIRDAGTIRGVDAAGEGGLLGLALWADPAGGQRWLYAYATSASDNRVIRAPLTGGAGAYAIGPAETVLDGIRKASNHNGGRIAFGPDGFLYVTTGDANYRSDAQDEASLNGKILRLTPLGEPAPGNPFGSAVYSLGHRNVQGIAWTRDGTMWASEFGQDTWDELNVIRPGANYGWPAVEGTSDDDRFTSPVVQWRTDDASPSGMAAVGDTLFLSALKGRRLWVIDTRGSGLLGEPRAVLSDQGRLRDAVAAPDGSLWVLTNNTDGRGDPRAGDDRLLDLPLAPAS